MTPVPAKPGDTISFWGSGFGPTNPATPTGTLVPYPPLYTLTSTPTMTIGGLTAQYAFGVLYPGGAGEFQIAFHLPDNLPDGDQKVAVAIEGVSTPDNVYLNIMK